MNLVERLNARFNNVIHDGLALVGAVVDPWLAKLERQAMSNALGRDIGLDYGDVLVAVEAEEEVHEPSVGHRVSADSLSTAVGDIGPGAGMVPPPPPAPGPSKCTCPTAECELLAEEICDEAEEAELLDEFMELGEFLDTATAEELAAMSQQREVSEDDLTMRIAEARYTWVHFKAAESSSSHYIAKVLMETYRITPR
ncbi:NKF protein [Mycobacterium phage Seagreen]|uniref:NKF protein n=1 Tax=Mycobacterium phage Seagreen TaxID=1698713 RepID=UPI0006BC7989|nr:NKF protein [Mycobacterium phage Seagreen]ALA48696.1 NKF protein [Mycobacterium phage Seagreen]